MCMIAVSILILMDLVLLPSLGDIIGNNDSCFNPYFNGSSTSTNMNNFSILNANMFQSLF